MKEVSGKMTRNEFNKIIKEDFEKILGHSISLDKAYELFKVAQFRPYALAKENDIAVVLGGVGQFRVYATNHTGTIIPKFYGSDSVTRILTKGQDLMDYAHNPQKYRVGEGALVEEVEEKPSKKSTPVKKATKKVVKEEVEEKPSKKVTATKKSPVPKKVVAEKEIVEDTDFDTDIDLDDFDF